MPIRLRIFFSSKSGTDPTPWGVGRSMRSRREGACNFFDLQSAKFLYRPKAPEKVTSSPKGLTGKTTSGVFPFFAATCRTEISGACGGNFATFTPTRSATQKGETPLVVSPNQSPLGLDFPLRALIEALRISPPAGQRSCKQLPVCFAYCEEGSAPSTA